MKLNPTIGDVRTAARNLSAVAGEFEVEGTNFVDMVCAASTYINIANEYGERWAGVSVPITRSWVSRQGLRHQGTLMSAIRGADGSAKDDPSKWLVRFYRACVLRAHVGDPAKAATYMIWTEEPKVFWFHAGEFLSDFDQLPMHFVLHFMLAAEVCGYKMPVCQQQSWWLVFYQKLVKKLHLTPETEADLDMRLGANEEAFKAAQQV